MRVTRPTSLAAAAMAALLLVPAGAATAAPARPTTFTNPVSASFADTYADPSLLRAKDGFWYAYGTSDPLREGEETVHRIPISRSSDLVHWTSVGDAFSDATLPTWAAEGAGIWAPDIRYVDGEYRMYYVVTETTVFNGPNDGAIGMATAPSPAGPWTDSGAPVVAPRPGASGNADDFLWTFDPSVVTDDDGRQWIFYGSYYGGIFVAPLSHDGRQVTGKAVQVAIDNKFEGAYAVHRDGWWYLFASTANCCAGPTTGYSVQVGRSRSVTGPYVDAEGVSLHTSRAGGTPTLVQNGNRWVGAGHNAVATDLAGQDWIVYHAIDRRDPYLTGTKGINERPMLLDRLDWIDGWPAVRAGRGPSAGRQRGPVTTGRTVTRFDDGVERPFRATGRWAEAQDPQSGGYLRSRGKATVTSRVRADGLRVEADLRAARTRAGVQVAVGDSTVRAVVDPNRGTLTLEQVRGQRVSSRTAALPAGTGASWHTVSLEVRDGRASAELSSARLGDPVAALDLRVRGADRIGRSGAFAAGAGADVDNLSVLPAATPVTRLARDVVPHRLDRSASDEFSGDALAAGWTWVRKDPAAAVSAGRLTWPTQAKDLTDKSNDAGVLLRDPGEGPWTVKTKVTTNLGVNTINNYAQAGLVAYVNDDLFTRLSVVSIWNTRQTEFGHERPYAGGRAYGGTIVGPPADTTWLRLTHRLDPRNGEHELRAWTSRDGRRWVKGGVWTLPAGADVRVGLIAHGGAGATAKFHYFRVYR